MEDGKVADQELAVMGFLEQEFAANHEEYLAAAGMVGEIASTVGAIAAAIIVTAVTGGTAGPGAAAALSSYFGVSQTAVAVTLAAAAGGTAKVLTKEAIGEEHNEVSETGARDFAIGGVDAAMTVLTGGVAKSLQASFFNLVGLKGAELTAEMSLGLVRATEAGVRQLGRRFIAGGVRAGIEGMLGGAVGELLLTAMDEETWRKNLWDTIVSFGAALLRGAAIGGATGVVSGGVMEALSSVVSKARLPKLLARLQSAGLSADKLETLTLDQAKWLGKVDDALQRGDREGALEIWETLSGELDPQTAANLRKGLFNLEDGAEDAARKIPAGNKTATGVAEKQKVPAVEGSKGEVFKLAKHGDHPSPRPSETQSHHGVMSAWMKKHFPGYKPNEAPAILMSTSAHQKTFGVYNTWRAAMKKEMGGKFDWRKVSESRMRDLSEKMFDAAGVPPQIRADYWKWFDRMKSSLTLSN